MIDEERVLHQIDICFVAVMQSLHLEVKKETRAFLRHTGSKLGEVLEGVHNEVQEEWERENENDFKQWNDDEHKSISIELSETDSGSIFASCKYPLCRKKYKRL